MKSFTAKLSALMLSTAAIHISNGRGFYTSWRFDRQIWNSITGGWSPVVDGLTGQKNLPIAVCIGADGTMQSIDSQETLTLAIKNGCHLEFVRGAGRIGTLKRGLDEAKDLKLKDDKVASVGSMLDLGHIEIDIVSDATGDQLVNIASDNDNLKKQWERVHCYHQYRAFKAQQYTQLAACRAVGYSTTYGLFTNLDALPNEVRQAWIDGETGKKLPDGKLSPKFSDPQIAEIYKANSTSGTGKGQRPVLEGKALELFETIKKGKETLVARVLSEKMLESWFTECPKGSLAANLISLIRGYKPGTNEVLPDVAGPDGRGAAFANFVRDNYPATTTEPQDQVTTPQDQVTTPQDQVTTPQDQVTTPQDQVTTPQDQVTTPQVTKRKGKRSKQTV